ncbi:hypothetical protein QQS21_009468 [Conoideocrella luteorostrata]|uniref:Prp 4 CRoW domain-containing protein n=1 Tax=Conoideocrella luteorostrata TaxID=1105319 RepID=A0AAJ0FXR8_9HYPO|nr:hypothetical protein QQS21_009468 [Conoideocrella luteorostrata]
MLFQTIASVAILATAANAASGEVKRQPYALAMMALPGQSLMRRDTNGYTPDQKQCKAGSTCAEACGASYAQCPGGKPDVAHCFDASAGESCCTDNSGNSCEKGYYCTHDAKQQTWCCPHDMDLAACAAAYTVTGLVAATSKPAPTTSSTSSTSSTISTTSQPPATTSASASSTTLSTTTSVPVLTTTAAKNTTISTASTGKTTAWTGFNSTISNGVPTQPSESAPSVTGVPPPANTIINSAAASGVSALLLIAAGVVALL